MSRAANGNYSLVLGNPVISGTIITTEWANTTLDDVAAALTDSLSRSGKGGMTADLAMGNHRVTGLAPSAAATDAPTSLQVRNSVFSWLFPVSSDVSGNTYTGTALLPDAPVAGTVFLFLADKTNTGPMTLSVNGGPAYPLLANGTAVEPGLVLVGTVVSTLWVANTWRVLGGISGDNLGISSITSADPQVLSAVLGANVITLTPHTNVPNGMVKLGADGLIPTSVIPTSGLNYIGNWSAAGGTNPAAANNGDFYVISVAGNLTLYRSSVPPAFTPQATAVVPNDQIIWKTPGTVDQPQGWYFLAAAAAVIASSVGLTPTPTFPAASNVQAWANLVDPYLGTLLPKAGGTLTGQVLQPAGPTVATSLINRQYVDTAIASVNIGVATFNTRVGAVTLLGADVTGALGYTPANLAGDTFTGPVTIPSLSITGNLTASGNISCVDVIPSGAVHGQKSVWFTKLDASPTTGAVAINFSNGQKQKLVMTGNCTLSFSFPGAGHYYLQLVGNFVPTWPAIGASWQWYGATSAPTHNVGTYGGALTLYYDGTLVVASYAPIGAV